MTLRTNINQIPFLPLWKTHSSRKKKNIGKIFQKRRKGQKKSSLLEFGREHFFAVGDSWLYHIPAQLCWLHPVLDKLLAPLSPQVGRFLDREAESRCLMNWGDLADAWPFPGPLRTDGPFSFTALVTYSATVLSSFPHTATGPVAVPTALAGENSFRCRRESCHCIIVTGIAGSLPPACREVCKD